MSRFHYLLLEFKLSAILLRYNHLNSIRPKLQVVLKLKFLQKSPQNYFNLFEVIVSHVKMK